MIREATKQDFINLPIKNCAVRIESLYRAYGLEVPFVRFYSDGEGTIASIMDGCCILHSSHRLTEEWLAFLYMLPDIKQLYTDSSIGEQVVKAFNLPHKTGVVMRLDKLSGDNRMLLQPPLQLLYQLLSSVFADYVSFDSWYVDISHRLRHNCCRIATITKDERPVACIMTIAEGKEAAVIGGVATDKAYRKQGLAQQCMETILATLIQTTVFISPVDAYAQQYYTRFGFVDSECWMEIDFT